MDHGNIGAEAPEKDYAILEDRNLAYMAEHGNQIAVHGIDYSSFRNPDAFVVPYEITDPMLGNVHLVDSYRSDLLISIGSLREKILDKDLDRSEPKYIVVALRRQGVDGNEYFLNNLKNWHDTGEFANRSNYYRRIFVVKMVHSDKSGDLELTLVDATDAIPYSNQNPEAGGGS